MQTGKALAARFFGPEGRRLLCEALLKQALVEGKRDVAEELAAAAVVEGCEASDIIITQGAVDTDIFFILAGKQVVGIDTSEIRAARIGVRGGNDLVVWIGRAANHAAKLTENRNDYPTWVTKAAYNQLAKWAKFGGQNESNMMWTQFKWTAMNDAPVYGSNWTWSVS